MWEKSGLWRHIIQEISEDITQLQTILDASINKAGEFLKTSFRMPEHSLTAQQIVFHMQGMKTIALATVTANNAPRVAPIATLLYRGDFYIPTLKKAARTKMLNKNSALSLTYYEGDDLAMIIHGSGELIPESDAAFAPLEKIHRDLNKSSLTAWGGEAVFIKIVARVWYTFARYPEQFPTE